VREAGFCQITLSAQDLVDHPDGVDAAIALVNTSGLQVGSFRAVCNFEGACGALHRYKLDVAKAQLGLCQSLSCHRLVLPSSDLPSCTSDKPALVRNLRQLAMLAIPLNIKIAYQGWPGGAVVKDFLSAWDLVCEADMPNLGLCLDTGDLLSQGNRLGDLLADLEMLDAEKLFLVQLADQLGKPGALLRVFPGDGDAREAVAALVSALHALGYRGNFSLAAFNTDHDQLPPRHVAQKALISAQWVGQDVLQRSVPLPNQIRLRRVVGA
jgi:sugar phosphate isomerase/epimerase